ncbi:hypothetical protein [Nocardia sp. NPDC059239]|uniref:hypothetical protein n=1 Tax=unclassified Nocardia TaxID=2637762 RepID=UPI003696A4FB
MTPSVGRIVHYQSYGTPGGEYLSEPLAALVTGVGGPAHTGADYVDLCVFYPNGASFKTVVRRADEPTPGHWNWPPRV